MSPRLRQYLATALCLVPALVLLGFETSRSRDEIAAAYTGLGGIAAMEPLIALAGPLAGGDDAQALARFQSVDAGRLARDQEFGTDSYSRALTAAVREGNPANPEALQITLDLAAEVAVASGLAANPASRDLTEVFRRLAATLAAAGRFSATLRSVPAQGEIPEAMRIELSSDAARLVASARVLPEGFADGGGQEPLAFAAILATGPLTAETVSRLRHRNTVYSQALAGLSTQMASTAATRLEARIAALEFQAMLVISAAVFSLCLGVAYAAGLAQALTAEAGRLAALKADALEVLRQAEGLMPAADGAAAPASAPPLRQS